MKKNLLYLWALICSVSLLTACSSDDDNTVNDETTPPEEEAVVTAPDVVGTYWGNLDISMLPDGSDQEVVIADGLPKFITFSQVSDTEVKMELKEFELFINGNILKFGDIVIDKCAVKKETDVSTFTGQQDLTFQGDAAALGTSSSDILFWECNSAIIVTCLLKSISESDIQVDRIHSKSNGLKVISEDIIQSPGEVCIYIEMFECSPSGSYLQAPLKMSQVVREVISSDFTIRKFDFGAYGVAFTQVSFIYVPRKFS